MQVQIHITNIQQEMQVISAEEGENVMQSEITFDIHYPNGGIQRNVSVFVRQPYGVDYANTEIEVTRPSNYEGPAFPHVDFSDKIEECYRSSLNRAIHIGENSNVKMTNNTIRFNDAFTIELPDIVGSDAW